MQRLAVSLILISLLTLSGCASHPAHRNHDPAMTTVSSGDDSERLQRSRARIAPDEEVADEEEGLGGFLESVIALLALPLLFGLP